MLEKTIKVLEKIKSINWWSIREDISLGIDEALLEVKEVQKPIYQKSEIAAAIQEWLNSQDNKDEVFALRARTTPYTANDMIKEIENQTEFGKELEQDIITLTIDLLFRKKETFDKPEKETCLTCKHRSKCKFADNVRDTFGLNSNEMWFSCYQSRIKC